MNDSFSALIWSAVFIGLAIFFVYRTYRQNIELGVQDDMGFRLIFIILGFASLYMALVFSEKMNSSDINEFILKGTSGIILIIGLFSLYVLFTTIKIRLSELGSTKVWKKLLYAAVISTVATWGGAMAGVTEGITLAKVVIGGLVVFSIQLLG